jgi:hypothetical protein
MAAALTRTGVIAVSLFGAFGTAYAAGSSQGFVLQPLSMITGQGVFIFSAGNHATPPACSTVGNDWAISLNTPGGRSQQALVMLAYITGKKIVVIGTGLCDAWGDRETPGYLHLID